MYEYSGDVINVKLKPDSCNDLEFRYLYTEIGKC